MLPQRSLLKTANNHTYHIVCLPTKIAPATIASRVIVVLTANAATAPDSLLVLPIMPLSSQPLEVANTDGSMERVCLFRGWTGGECLCALRSGLGICAVGEEDQCEARCGDLNLTHIIGAVDGLYVQVSF